MAKLTNVITISEDVITVEGVRYVKTTEAAKGGDIVRSNNQRLYLDVSINSYYAVVESGGDVYFRDNGEDIRRLCGKRGLKVDPQYFTVYRREAAAQYREVNRAAKVGERIRIVARDSSDEPYNNGDEFTVNSVDDDGSDDVRITCDGRDSKLVERKEYVVLEPITAYREVKREAKKGELIRIVACDEGEEAYENGAEFVVNDASSWLVRVKAAGRDTYPVCHREYVVLEPIPAGSGVKRKAKKGERICIVSRARGEREYENGAEFVVNEVDYYVRVSAGSRDDYPVQHDEYVVLEPIEAPGTAQLLEQKRAELAELERKLAEEQRLKVGEYAKVIRKGAGHSADIRAFVKVLEDDGPGDRKPFRCENVDGSELRAPWFAEGDLQRATAEEIAEITRLKVGDFVKVLNSGTLTNGGEVPTGEIAKVTADDRTAIPFEIESIKTGKKAWAEKSHIRRATPEEVAAASRLKVGEYAKVVNLDWTQYSKGDIVKLVKDDHTRRPFLTERVSDGLTQWLCEADVVRATPEEVEAAQKPRIKVGDYVKLQISEGKRPRNGWAGVSNGDVGKVLAVSGDDLRIKFENHPNWGGVISEVVLLTEEEAQAEVKKAEETSRWAAFGREVNEFKVGDVVRFLGYDGMHGLHDYKGMTTTITDIRIDPDVYYELDKPSFVRNIYGTWTKAHQIELVTPVESVFPKSA
ncbi:hypothetical protein [Paenibacillus sp. 1P03SA]|uniref:hypothetical protein n=1 Tax=Paenibacillus sp. 1P03SA TaxID=3132294 RepID=UPI00399FF277